MLEFSTMKRVFQFASKLIQISLLFVAATVFFSTTSFAGTIVNIRTGISSSSLVYAVNSMEAGDTLLCTGLFTEQSINVPNKTNLTIKASTETTVCTVDANFLGQLFYIPFNSNITIEGLTLKNGSAARNGVAIEIGGTTSNLWLRNVKIYNCITTGPSNNGGAIYSPAATNNIYAYNCIFEKNTATANGGAIYGGSFRAINCVFYNDQAAVRGDEVSNSTFTSTNSIFWSSTPTNDAFYTLTSPNFRYSNIQPLSYVAGTGNISLEPYFISTNEASSGFLRLGAGSKCIDAGIIETGVPTKDAAGNSRPHAIYADIGAYESQGPYIMVTFPSSGEALLADTLYNITWASSDETGYGSAPNVNIRYSSDGGVSWTLVNSVANIGTFPWTTPSLPSETCLISIEAKNASGIWNLDSSDKLFVLVRPLVYVAPATSGGNDTTGTGLYAAPFASIKKAIRSVAASGEVRVQPGLYQPLADKFDKWSMASIPSRVISTYIRISPEATGVVTLDAQKFGRIISFEGNLRVTIEGITMINGRATAEGGGAIYMQPSSILTLRNMVIRNCTVEAGGNYGGAIYAPNNVNDLLFASNTIFANNRAPYGAVIYNCSASATNCAFVGNIAGSNGGLSYLSTWNKLSNSIVWFNGAPNNPVFYATPPATMRYCDIQPNGFAAGTGNITIEPNFVSTNEASTSFLKLAIGSKVIDAGTVESGVPTKDAVGYRRPHGLGADMGVYEFTGPSVMVTYPNTGEVFMPGQSINITWKASDELNLPLSINLRYSNDNGSTWNNVSGGIGISNTGTLAWTIPATTSTQYLVSVEAINSVSAFNYDSSAIPFSVLLPMAYIATTGNDSNNGTLGSPFLTLGKAVNSIQSSGEVRVQPGLYQPASNTFDNFSMTSIPSRVISTYIRLSPEATGVVTLDARTFGRIISYEGSLRVTLEGITMINGRATAEGGGAIYMQPYSSLTLINMVIRNCTGEGTSTYGGAIHASNASNDYIYAYNSIFANNRAYYGGVFGYGNVTATNCAFVGNIAGQYGGVSAATTWNKFSNSIVWFNGSGQTGVPSYVTFYPSIPATMKYCDLQPIAYATGTGNISIEPSFVSTNELSTNFLRLMPGSKVIDVGTVEPGVPNLDAVGYVRPHGLGSDMGVYEFTGPSVMLTYPNTGEVFTPGQLINITWSAFDEINGTPLINLRYSNDNGSTWRTIVLGTVNDGSQPWTVSTEASTQYLISIEAYNSGGTNYDSSAQNFSVLLPIAYVATAVGGGSDSNSGTLASPFLTLGKAVNSVLPTSEVRVQPGLYQQVANTYDMWSMANVPSSVISLNIRISPEATGIVTMDAQRTGRIIRFEGSINATIEGITMMNGRATNEGGGAIYIPLNSKLWLKNDILRSCSAEGSAYGGAIYAANNSNDYLYASNTIFANNKAPYGGAFYSFTATATNCSFVGNIATTYGGVTYNTTWNKLADSIIWYNTGVNPYPIFGTAIPTTMRYCDAQPNGFYKATGNISIEPKFVTTNETSTSFLNLNIGSPCIDTASNDSISTDIIGNVRPRGLGYDMGVYEYQGITVILDAPLGGPTQKLSAGALYNVRWRISYEAAATYTVRLSTTEARIWDTLITSGTTTPGITDYSFSWTVPMLISKECMVSVEALSGSVWNYDTSDAKFEITTIIDTQEPTVIVSTPASAGKAYTAGQYLTIYYNAYDDIGLATDPINIWYTTNNGLTWLPIDSSLPNTGVYTWEVVNTPTAQGFISVEALDSVGKLGKAKSNYVFSILPSSIIYISPTGFDITGEGSLTKPYKTIQRGLDTVSSGGQIRMLPGIFSGTGNYNVVWPITKDNITISTSPGATGISTLDGQKIDRFVSFETTVNITFENISIKNYSADTYGGFITSPIGGNLWFNNVDVQSCTSEVGPGGFIYSDNFDLNVYLSNSYIKGCKALPVGGVGYRGNWNIVNTIFTSNESINSPGGVFYEISIEAIGCIFNYNKTLSQGGVGGNLYGSFINCTFESNSAGNSGGVFLTFHGTLTNCDIKNNTAVNNGGAIFACSATIEGCTFTNNRADSGGAIYAYDFTGYNLNNCIFINNRATSYGGAIHNTSFSAKNSYFTNNSSGIGGGLFMNGTATATNCVMSGNHSNAGGLFTSGSLYSTNCTIYGNTAEVGAVCGSSYTFVGKNDIIYGNLATDGNVFTSQSYYSPTMTYCDIQPTAYTGAIGNISAEPSFVSSFEPYDLNLNASSLCIDSGTSEGAPLFDILGRARPFGKGFDMGAYESTYTLGPSIEAVFINNARFFSGDIVSRNVLMRIVVRDASGVATPEMYLDAAVTPITFVLSQGTTFEGEWTARFVMAPSMSDVSSHSFRFNLVNGEGLASTQYMSAVVMTGSVQMIGRPLNFPNPFRPLSTDPTKSTTTIQYTLSADAPIILVIYDVTGKEIKRIGAQAGQDGGRAGINSAQWNGQSIFGEVAGNGMYIYKIISKDKVIGTGKLVILD